MEQESKMSSQDATSIATDKNTQIKKSEGDGEELKYSSVSIKPVKSNKVSALSRIKAIQENDWKTWKGPNTKNAGRPGTAGIIKARTKKEPHKLEVQDDTRFKNLLKIMNKMQVQDEDCVVQIGNLFRISYLIN